MKKLLSSVKLCCMCYAFHGSTEREGRMGGLDIMTSHIFPHSRPS